MTTLGPLPPEWRVVRLGEIFRLVPRASRRKIILDHERYSTISVQLYGKGVVLKQEVAGSELKTKIWFEAKPSDFIMLKIWARKGAYGFIPKGLTNIIVSSDYPILELNREIACQDFVEFVLGRPECWSNLEFGAKGATNRQRVHERDFLKLVNIPLPPLAEQHAIAHTLRAVQQAKECSERVVTALRELKQSLMQHLFRYGPVPLASRDRVPLCETALGPLPAHWQVVRLGEVAQTKTGGTPDRSREEYFGGKIPWVKSGELNDSTIKFTEETLTESGLKHSNAKIFPKGTLLLAMYGATAGKTGILEIDAATNQAICAIFPYPEILPTYLSYTFVYYRAYLLNERYGGAQPNISQTVIKNFFIPLPPLAEQQRIAAILQAVDRRIAVEEACARAHTDLFATLLRDLLSARRRVPPEVVAQFARES